MKTLCRVCQGIDLDLITGPRKPKVADLSFELGTYEAICSRASSCSFCTVIVEYFNKSRSVNTGCIPLDKVYCLTSFLRWPNYMASCAYRDDFIDGHGQLGHSVDNEKGVEIDFGRGKGSLRFCRLYDHDLPIETQRLRERRVSSKLDVALFTRWLQTCCDKHGEHCDKPTWLSPWEPEYLRVIDVRTRCVVKAQHGCKFAALSYVWGGPQYVINETQMRNLPFRLPDAPMLSQTLVDAMLLCHQIGIDYLWVDALCITQDPPVNADKSFQLQQMDRIYRSAMLTICTASSASATHGIDELRFRPAFQNIISFKDKLYAITESSLEEDVETTPWNWRGWTYQERVLSRRLLVITRKQSYWICQCDTWTESTISEPIVDLMKHQMIAADGSVLPPQRSYGFGHDSMLQGYFNSAHHDRLFATYDSLMQEYTRRSLGEPRDGLHAIQGILNLITESGPCRGTRFIHGLPMERFDVALLWKPFSRLTRDPCLDPSQQLPSWSWVSWFTNAGPGAYYDTSDFFVGVSIKTAVIWYTLDKSGVSKLLLANGAVERHICGLPSGLDPSLPPKLSSARILHNDFYLHFLSTVARFGIGKQLPWNSIHPMADTLPERWQPFVQHWTGNHMYQLLNRLGSCVGHIILNDSEVPNLVANLHDFVFLSYSQGFDSMLHETDLALLDKHRPNTHKYDVVSCMMITRDETTGFAERCAVGKVLQSAWEVAVVKTEWIILG